MTRILRSLGLVAGTSVCLSGEALAQRLQTSRFVQPRADTARVVWQQRVERPSVERYWLTGAVVGALVGGIRGYNLIKHDDSDASLFPKATVFLEAAAGAFAGSLVGVAVYYVRYSPRHSRPLVARRSAS